MRFGGGIGRITLPAGAAWWLDEHLPGSRVWCDVNSSSALRFFTDPPRELPINTNQWAYPPAVMTENQMLRAGLEPFAPVAERYGIDAVVLRVATSVALFEALAGDDGWTLVHVEGEHAVFLRATGDLAARARELALENFRGDAAAYAARQRALDPLAESALVPAGRILLEGGALDVAIAVIGLAAQELPGKARVQGMLGSAYASRADRRRRSADAAFAEDVRRARECFDRALVLDPGYEFAARSRERLDRLRVP
jgi:predicted Zn-dependent protease